MHASQCRSEVGIKFLDTLLEEGYMCIVMQARISGCQGHYEKKDVTQTKWSPRSLSHSP